MNSSNPEKIVVMYTSDTGALDNRMFDMKTRGFNRYSWWWVHVYDECKKQGITMMTYDVYLKMEKQPPALLISNTIEIGKQKELLRNPNLHPVAYILFEGPLYGSIAYWNLARQTGMFPHGFMTTGAAGRQAKTTTYHAHVDGLAYSQDTVVPGGFKDRKYLTLINTNTRMNPLKVLFAKFVQFIRPFPSFVPKELYIDRMRAIKYFSKLGDRFDLYGYRWNNPIPYASKKMEAEFRPGIKASYRGMIDGDKMEVLKKYKFSICFENTIFGGFITEKIFDSMFSGCIPVYWGAPDITDFVPANAFIDFRNFKSYEELDQFLSSMDEATYNTYIENIRKYIRSEQYYNLTKEHFAKLIIPLFEEYFNRLR